MFAAVRCALGSRAGVRSQLHASSPLSIEIPCSFACRAVESSIESSQSTRRVDLQKFFSRLMSPVISVLKFRVVLHVAQSGRQSSRRNRVVESVSGNFPVDWWVLSSQYWIPLYCCMSRSRVVNRVTAIESSGRSPEISESTDES